MKTDGIGLSFASSSSIWAKAWLAPKAAQPTTTNAQIAVNFLVTRNLLPRAATIETFLQGRKCRNTNRAKYLTGYIVPMVAPPANLKTKN
jgi:hypothetical protein